MAYDRELADRLHELLRDEPGLDLKPMFGGLAFLIDGKMAVSVSRQGGLLLRCDPARTEELVTAEHVERFVMRGRPMDGWLHVGVAAIDTDEDLARWVGYGTNWARTLPASRSRR